jgi:hypothetical protein
MISIFSFFAPLARNSHSRMNGQHPATRTKAQTKPFEHKWFHEFMQQLSLSDLRPSTVSSWKTDIDHSGWFFGFRINPHFALCFPAKVDGGQWQFRNKQKGRITSRHKNRFRSLLQMYLQLNRSRFLGISKPNTLKPASQ